MLSTIHKNGFLRDMVKELASAQKTVTLKSRFLFQNPDLPFGRVFEFDIDTISKDFESILYRSRFYSKLLDTAYDVIQSPEQVNPDLVLHHHYANEHSFFATLHQDIGDGILSNLFLNEGFLPVHTSLYAVPVYLDENSDEHQICTFYVLWYNTPRKFFPVSLS